MAVEGTVPEQEAIDEIRVEARREALIAICELEQFVRNDERLGGVDAILISVLLQQVTERVRIYRMAVNVADEPERQSRLADAENGARRGIGRRRMASRHTFVPGP